MKQIKLDYIQHNIAPYAVKRIGVFNKQNKLVGTINVEHLKDKYSTRLYRFGVLSDVHHKQNNETAEPQADFQNALTVFNDKEDVAFTCICGDITENFTYEEQQAYKSNVSKCSSKTPVYTTTGNHDCVRNGDTDAVWEAAWKKTTNRNRTYEITYNNDHFLFLGMYVWALGADRSPYLDSDIDWLEQKLNEYDGERCFIFTHLFFYDKTGNFNSVYPQSNWLCGDENSQFARLTDLNNSHPNTFWFSGHSHWKWYLQKYQKNANIYGKYCGWNIHIPSCASPIDTEFVGNGQGYNGTNWTREDKTDRCYLSSEGAIVDVYKDYIEIRGISFKRNNEEGYVMKYIPTAQYRLKSGTGNNDIFSDISFKSIDYVKAADFYDNTSKRPPYSVNDLKYNYVEVKFNGPSQGYCIKPTSFINNPTQAVLRVEDVKCFLSPNSNPDNKTQLASVPKFVGFYGGTNYINGTAAQYGIYNDFLISVSDDYPNYIGLSPFQTSSKFVSNNETLNIGSDSSQNSLVIQMRIKIGYQSLL